MGFHVGIYSEAEKKEYYAREFANTVSTYRFLLLAKGRIYQERESRLEDYLAK